MDKVANRKEMLRISLQIIDAKPQFKPYATRDILAQMPIMATEVEKLRGGAK
jgi:hypothetical protein